MIATRSVPRAILLAAIVSMCALAWAPLLGEGRPRVRLSAPSHDFGAIAAGGRARHVLTLSNDSDEPLEIRGISTSNPALAATVSPSVAPRSSTEIVIELDAAELAGRFSGAVTLVTSDPSAETLRIGIEALIGAEVEVVPKPLLALRAFRWEVAAKERSVELVNRGRTPLEIVAVQGVDRERFTVDVVPVEAGARYRLQARLRSDGPAGMGQAGLRVQTNKGDVGIMVLTLLKDRVYTIPPSLDFEVIDAGAIARNPDLLNLVAQPLHVYRLGSEDFRVEVLSAPPFVSVDIEPANGPGVVQPIPDQGPTSIFDLTVTPVLASLPPGPFAGTIRLGTSDPEAKVIEIPIAGRRR